MAGVGASVGRFMTSFIISFIAGYMVLLAALYVFQRNLLYFPDTTLYTPTAGGVPEMKSVTVTTEDGLDLTAWYRPASSGRPTLVIFHGNAGNIGGRGDKARPYLDAGFGVLLAEYRGYGSNPGTPSEEGLFADGRAALDFLAAEGVKADRVVLYGESLGSGVAVRMAWEMAVTAPAAALILEAPYTSITDVAAHHYPYVPVRMLIKDPFDSVSRIAGVGSPLYIIHGEDDKTVPAKFGRRLFEAAVEPKESRWVQNADHMELYDLGAADMIIDFITRHVPNLH